jgi:hypothetical protein
MADEMLLWDWLLDRLAPGHYRVAATELVRDGHARRTEVLFTNELDARRFRRWAAGRGFEIIEEGP